MTQTITQTTMITSKTQRRAQILVLLLSALVAVQAAPQPQQQQLDANSLRLARLTSALRFRRHASISHDSALLEQGDEQALRRHLPDLIAQAHNDKQAERALLRMLIQASLRPNANMAPNTGSWQLDGSAGEGNNLAQYNQANSGSVGEFVPTRAVRLFSQQVQPDAGTTSSLGDLAADLEAQLASAGDLAAVAEPSSQQSYSSLDKREYIKPCSFNAISCVRTPFGRRIK